jgi:hypothetical protein
VLPLVLYMAIFAVHITVLNKRYNQRLSSVLLLALKPHLGFPTSGVRMKGDLFPVSFPLFYPLGIPRAQKGQHPDLKEQENFLTAILLLISNQSLLSLE